MKNTFALLSLFLFMSPILNAQSFLEETDQVAGASCGPQVVSTKNVIEESRGWKEDVVYTVVLNTCTGAVTQDRQVLRACRIVDCSW